MQLLPRFLLSRWSNTIGAMKLLMSRDMSESQRSQCEYNRSAASYSSKSNVVAKAACWWSKSDSWHFMDDAKDKTKAPRERKPPPTPKFQPKIIRDSNPDFRINPDTDSDVCRICPKMLWMHYLVGVSHFAKYATNRPLIVWEMLTNVQKSPIPQWWRK